MRLTLKIALANLGWCRLSEVDIWRIRKEIQQLYKRSAQVDPFKDEKSEKEFAAIDWNIRYLKKTLYCHDYMVNEKEPAPSPKVKADSF
jgi:hypothetical protein